MKQLLITYTAAALCAAANIAAGAALASHELRFSRAVLKRGAIKALAILACVGALCVCALLVGDTVTVESGFGTLGVSALASLIGVSALGIYVKKLSENLVLLLKIKSEGGLG